MPLSRMAVVNRLQTMCAPNVCPLEDMEGNAKCRNWGAFEGLGSPTISDNIAILYSTCDFLFNFNTNYASISY